MAQITRSTGIAIEGTPYRAGGGYEGSTPELDSTVMAAAEMLAAAFGQDTVIRFNSDRRSGSAFLKDTLPGFSGSCRVGLGAMIIAQPPTGMSRFEWHESIAARVGWGEPEFWAEIKAAPQVVTITTYLSQAVAVSDAPLIGG